MKISIVTPTFNSAKTISNNITSIVNQSYKNFEQIIVDNLSTDETLKIVSSIYKDSGLIDKLKIICEKDSGISDAFNKGIKASTGDVIAILNSDDEYYSYDIFENVIKAFQNPEIIFVHGDIEFIDKVYGSNVRKPLFCPVTTAMPFNHPTMFFKKEIYERNGLYDVSYKFAMDFEFIVRSEKNIESFRSKGKYLQNKPLVLMNAGGESWKNEIQSIKETKSALIRHGIWKFSARKNYFLRLLMTELKTFLSRLKLEFLVRQWRNYKWK